MAQVSQMRMAVFRGIREVGIERVAVPVPGEGEARIRILASGICGSDLHRYRGCDPWGGAGTFPRSGGHEMAGVIDALGPGAGGFLVGQVVSVEPAQMGGCGRCACCERGATNLCTNREGRPGPRRSTGFAEFDIARLSQIHPIASDLPVEAAALADVFACAIHAVHRVPIAAGSNVVVIGTGPVGLALGQIIRQRGGYITVFGRHPALLKSAMAVGAADEGICCEGAPSGTRRCLADTVFEAAGGSTSDSIRLATQAVRHGGRIGIVGAFAGDVCLPYAVANRKELTLALCNGYGFHLGRSEFQMALETLQMQTTEARRLITHRFGLDDIATAFQTADDKARTGAIKVMLDPAGERG
jgi:threonine dehydrogenase-like Zn-dependent dehydrogenase